VSRLISPRRSGVRIVPLRDGGCLAHFLGDHVALVPLEEALGLELVIGRDQEEGRLRACRLVLVTPTVRANDVVRSA
jgi:hypothetical protein